jgi:hypothetical protein
MTINQPTSNLPGIQSATGGGNNVVNIPPVSNAPANFPDNPQTNTTDPDQLSHLLELKFAGIPFPATNFTENSSQDVAVHKYPNVDSARVELTGRNPSTYSFRACLTNNIYPSTKEHWKQGDLFPRVFELLLNELYDSTDFHTFQHPFLGIRNVVPVTWSYSFVGTGPRDGVYLDVTLTETIGDGDIKTTISAPSTLADMQSTAASIDNEISSTKLSKMNPPNLTLGEFFSKINGFVRNVVSFPQQTIGALNAQVVQVSSSLQGAGAALATSPFQLFQSGRAIVNQNKGLILHGPVSNAYYYDKAVFGEVKQVFNIDQDALNNVYARVGTLNSNANNNAAQAIENAIAFTEAMIVYYQALGRVETATLVFYLFQFLGQLQQALISLFNNNRSYKINTYVVRVPSTLFALSRVLNNSIQQLLQLNSKLNKLYIIPDGTVIRYYQASQ